MAPAAPSPPPPIRFCFLFFFPRGAPEEGRGKHSLSTRVPVCPHWGVRHVQSTAPHPFLRGGAHCGADIVTVHPDIVTPNVLRSPFCMAGGKSIRMRGQGQNCPRGQEPPVEPWALSSPSSFLAQPPLLGWGGWKPCSVTVPFSFCFLPLPLGRYRISRLKIAPRGTGGWQLQITKFKPHET